MSINIKGILRNITIDGHQIKFWFQFYKNNEIITTGREGDYDFVFFPVKVLKGKTINQIKDHIGNFIEKRCSHILLSEYMKNNLHPRYQVEKLFADNIKSQLDDVIEQFIGLEKSVTFSTVLVDTDFDNMLDQAWDINDELILEKRNITPIEEE